MVVNLSNCEFLKGKNEKMIGVLSNCVSLARNKKGDKMEIKTSRNRLTITLSIFISVTNISDW